MSSDQWTTCLLGDFMEFKNGLNTEKSQYGKGLKFVNVMDVFKNDTLTEEKIIGRVTVSDNQLKDNLLKFGDVLFNRTSETFDEIAMAAVYLDDAPATFGGFVIRGRPELGMLYPNYSAYAFQSTEFRKQAIRFGQGAVRSNIGQKDLSKVRFLLPPHQEQKKIAQILSTWDKAITTTEKLLKNSQQQKKALMQQLLTGKKRLLDDNGVRFKGEWKIGHLNDFVRKIYGGGTPQRSNPDYWGEGIPWITVKDLVKTHIDGAQESINEKGLNESAANLVRKGTIIIATRMAVGKTVVASCDVAINQDLKAIIPTDDLRSEYLFYWFIFNSSKIEKMGTGSTVKGVQVESIRKLKIKIPGSMKEQLSIIKVLDNIEQIILFYKQKISCLKQEKKALMQQLLTGKRRVKIDNKEVA